MKYAQLIMGLLIGTALGAALVAGKNGPISGGAGDMDEARIQEIVRTTLDGEGKRIMDAVQKFQAEERNQTVGNANALLQDAEVRAAIYDDASVAFVGPKDAEKVVVEFFDYNCPACKMQYKAFKELLATNKDVKILFHEYPIFGPQSETNSKIALGVFKVAPKNYLAWHEKMMSAEGRTDEKGAYGFVKAVGINVAKVKAYAESAEATEALERSRSVGRKLGIQGTPTLIIGNEMIPHAASPEDIKAKLGN